MNEMRGMGNRVWGWCVGKLGPPGYQFYNLWPDLSPGAFCIMLMLMVGTGNTVQTMGISRRDGEKLCKAAYRDGQ